MAIAAKTMTTKALTYILLSILAAHKENKIIKASKLGKVHLQRVHIKDQITIQLVWNLTKPKRRKLKNREMKQLAIKSSRDINLNNSSKIEFLQENPTVNKRTNQLKSRNVIFASP